VNDLTTQRMPWDAVPLEETVTLLQRDFAYAVAYTAVMVHSNREELRMVANTLRGQIVPRGEGRFTDGTTIEITDIGMPQPGVQVMTVDEVFKRTTDAARALGLVPK
jgi:hypothetical protein